MNNHAYMVEKLLEWNPHWKRDTVTSWSQHQVTAIYLKEKSKLEGKKRKTRKKGRTHHDKSYMVEKLLEWDPSLSKTEVVGLSISELEDVFLKTQRKVVEHVINSLK